VVDAHRHEAVHVANPLHGRGWSVDFAIEEVAVESTLLASTSHQHRVEFFRAAAPIGRRSAA